ncbi:MAG: hypothetical protein U1E29_08240 [Coriobacteriia bacterium]|nr:hypothetical protein [Coriobacteriia bacterium]
MLNTSAWPVMDLDVLREIHLDPRNVRLDNPNARVEADIMEDLFANENALSLVEGICRLGYLTHETPVVVKRGVKYIIVEGNRRLAALKAIQNPHLVPDYQVKVAGLASLHPDRASLSRIRVMLAPSQDEADQLIAAIHTSNLRRPWTPARQAAFFQAQVDAGRSLSDLISRYPTIDVKRFVLRAKIINLFKKMSYEDSELVEFVGGQRYKKGVSTLARIFESKEFLSLTGLRLDDTGELAKDISDALMKKMATVIVRAMRDKSIDTRSLNKVTSPRFRQLMKELWLIKGEQSAEMSTHSDDGLATSEHGGGEPTGGEQVGPPETGGGAEVGSGSRTASTGTKTKRAPAPPRPRTQYLEVSNWSAPSTYPEAVRLVVDELSDLDIQTHPHAAYLLLRTILEKGIKSFAETKGEDIRKTNNDGKGFVQLGHVLKWLLEYVKDPTHKAPSGMLQCVDKVRGSKLVSMATKETADAVAHNHRFRVDSDDVEHGWESMDPIIRYLMKP